MTGFDDRITDLLSQMSLDEKLAQLGCVWSTQLVDDEAFSESKARELIPHGAGEITRVAASTGLHPDGNARFMNEIQRYHVEGTRLGIPTMTNEESVAGFCARDATQFPQAIGLAATWEPDLIERMADVIRRQMVAAGSRHTLSPVLDVARDARWGRLEETYGEDPYLCGRMGVAYVRGLQGDLTDGVAGTAKHFLAYGASEGGFNHAPAHVGPRELREVYAEPFRAVINEARVATVMNSYGEVDGLPCGGTAEILTGLLRDELGFDGCVVADYMTTQLLISYHKVAADPAEAGRMALEAGLDLELPATACFSALKPLIEDGSLPIATLDQAVARVLRVKFALGLFERPYVDEGAALAAYGRDDDRDLARELAAKSVVVLRNEDGVLPLDPAAKVAVIGPSADDVRLLQGDYHYPAHLEMIYESSREASGIMPHAGGAFAPGPYFPESVTPLEAMRGRADVAYSKGCGLDDDDRSGFDAAVAAARTADVTVLFVGGRSGLRPHCTSGEFRDSSSLELPGVQHELIEAVVASGTPTVVVVISGRAHALPWVAEHAAAFVYAWVPGEQGGHGIADVLYGDASPGRLPVSLPHSVGQVPVFASHKSGSGGSVPYRDYVDGPCAPLYPLGHGLAYTTFAYGELEITSGSTSEPIEVSVDVTNTGDRDGDEVVQCYVHDQVASCTRPIRQLVGFVRVPIAPGARKRVTFTVHPSRLAFYDRSMRLVTEPGAFTVMVGSSSTDVRAETTVTLDGDVAEFKARDIRPTEVRVR